MNPLKDSLQMTNREASLSLGELTPEMGLARVSGFKIGGPLKDLLMSFGLIPGIEVTVEGRIPFSRSLILRMGMGRGSWRGVLRASEAEIVMVTIEGAAK